MFVYAPPLAAVWAKRTTTVRRPRHQAFNVPDQ